MEKEIELLKTRLNTAKINIELEISKINSFSNIFVAIFIGFSIPLFFKFGWNIFLFSSLSIIFIYLIFLNNMLETLKEARIEYFVYSLELADKLEVNKKFEDNIKDLRRRVNMLKLFGIFWDNKKMFKKLREESYKK